MARIAIVGSREYERLGDVAYFVAALPPGTTVVTGGAKGVDSKAESIAKVFTDLGLEVHKPNYRLAGKHAPLVRNLVIAAVCDAMVAFWDGKSRGTWHAMEAAKRFGKPVWVWPMTSMSKP